MYTEQDYNDGKTYEFQNSHTRPDMIRALGRYVLHGIAPGGFLLAVLENDLMEATERADQENLRNLPAYAAFLYNEVPGSCHGSREKVNAWMKARQEKRARNEASDTTA